MKQAGVTADLTVALPNLKRNLDTLQLAQELRSNQQQRIKVQQKPDGTPYAPRKQRKNLRGKHG